MVALKVTITIQPFIKKTSSNLSEMCHWAILLTLFMGLIIVLDAAGEDGGDTYDTILAFFLIVITIIPSIFSFALILVELQEDDPEFDTLAINEDNDHYNVNQPPPSSSYDEKEVQMNELLPSS